MLVLAALSFRLLYYICLTIFTDDLVTGSLKHEISGALTGVLDVGKLRWYISIMFLELKYCLAKFTYKTFKW